MDNQIPSKERGEEFIKAIVKAAMVSLISIGVKTEVNINRFMIRFEEEVEKRLKEIGMMKDEEPTTPAILKIDKVDTQENIPQKDSSQEDIEKLKLHPFTIKSLRAANINTILELIEAMQKDDLSKIKGIKEKSAEKIRQAIKNYKA